jgi:hypothetical protein
LCEIFYEKAARKMLVKLTPGQFKAKVFFSPIGRMLLDHPEENVSAKTMQAALCYHHFCNYSECRLMLSPVNVIIRLM